MKALVLILSVLTSVYAQAEIENSTLAKRHQDLIEKALVKQCSMGRGFIKEVQNKVELVRVDQGIVDEKYETQFEVHIRMDQNIFDIYDVTVKSSYYAQYDHASQEYGTYEIDEISLCSMR